MASVPTMPELLLPIDEAADRIGMSVRHLRRLVSDRRIRHYRLGRSLRFDPADLAAYVAAGRVDPTDTDR